jgi:hypothetical protein
MSSLFEQDEHPGKPRILFIGLAQSSHTHSWIDLFKDTQLNVRLFSSSVDLPPTHWNTRTYVIGTNGRHSLDPTTRKCLWDSGSATRLLYGTVARAKGRSLNTNWFINDWFLRIVRDWRPHIVHTFGLDTAHFYFPLHQKLASAYAPKWVLQTRGGSDLQLAHLDPEQNAGIARMLRACDQLLSDNILNFSIARDMGVREEQLSPIGTVPGTGGIDVGSLADRVTASPSNRRSIVWPKAYECVWSKSLPVLEALKACWERLQPCAVEMLAADAETTSWFRTLPANIRDRCNLQMRVPREESLRLMASARVMLAPSLVDGVPNSMYEAMASGALPIVSPLASICPVVEEETNVLFARNLHPEEIASALVRAMTDDSFVDEAAQRNLELVRRIANRDVVRSRVVKFYNSLAGGEQLHRLKERGAFCI